MPWKNAWLDTRQSRGIQCHANPSLTRFARSWVFCTQPMAIGESALVSGAAMLWKEFFVVLLASCIVFGAPVMAKPIQQGSFSSKGTGAGSVTVGAATYGYFTLTAADGDVGFDLSGTPHVFHAGWFYRVSGDTREFPINGVPTDSNYASPTITLTYANVGGRGLLSAQAVDFLQQPSANGGASVRNTLTLTNISAVAQTVSVFRYLDADLAGGAGNDSAVAIGTANNHLRIVDGGIATLDFYADASSYRVTPYATVLNALNDAVVDNFTNTGTPFAPSDFTGGFQWTAVTLAPGASRTFTANMDLTTTATELGGPGEDSDQTITGVGTVVNSYTTLASHIGSTLTVASAAALTLPAAACPSAVDGCEATRRALQRGDLLMVYQPQGATIDGTDTVAYGNVTAYNGAGRYEYVYVASVAGNVITIADSDAGAATCTGGLRFMYAAGAMVVRVPQYSNLTVAGAASIVPSPWDGSTGGVVAIHVGGTPIGSAGTLTLNGSIDASGRGFRGGAVVDRAVIFGSASFVCADPAGAQKGEGIAAGIFGTATGLCRGAPANGGGGGNNHNAGGGGGANGGFNTAAIEGGWLRGIGVFAPGPGGSGPGSPFAFTPSWQLDPEIDPDGAGPMPLQTSTGGGRGGYTYGAATNNPQTTGPGNGAWAGDARRVAGGLGGRPLAGNPLVGDPYRRLYFGGGGGAGEMNNTQGGNGGAGGGLVFLMASDLVGSGSVLANGAAGQNTAGLGNNDAPGGGGGGGTIVLSAGLVSVATTSARGGAGGNQLAIVVESEGAGGGGGGGVVLGPAAASAVAGGANGTSDSNGLRDPLDDVSTRRFPPNGATGGAPGSLGSPPSAIGAASPYSCLVGPAFTTPVSNAWFESTTRSDQMTQVRFASAAEIAQAGYFLLADTPSGRQRVGGFIAATAGAADKARSYEATVSLPAGTIQLFLADVDVSGKQTLRGPFVPGQAYGTPPVDTPFDWSRSQIELAAWRGTARGSGTPVARLGVRERGMYRVTHEQLLAAGFDFSGMPSASLALTAKNGAVPRRIRGGASFGPGSSIEFFGDAVASLWSRDRYYLLSIDPANALEMTLESRMVAARETSSYQAQLRYAPQNGYNEASPVGDPWYADRLVANGGATSKTVNLNGPVPLTSSGELEVVLWGGIDWPGPKTDHSVEVWYNGQQVAAERFDGVASARLRIPVAITSAGHAVQVRLPLNTGHPADIVHLESVELRYSALARGTGTVFFGGGLQGTAADTIFAEGGGDPAGAAIAGTLTIDNVGGQDQRAYRIDGGAATEYVFNGSPLALYAGAFSESSELWVSPAAQLLSPAISSIASPTQLFGAPSDWLVITHGVFAPALGELVTRRQGQGLTTRVVEVDAIYAHYSAGNPDPAAIRHYIAAARETLGTDYVLLVGADTTDAPGYLGSGSVSFLPTPYVTTSLFVRYAPGDPLLADGDGDGVPDLALGRLPVRTLAETQEAVRKILAYETQPSTNKVMLAAGPVDPYLARSFTEDADSFAAGLSAGWTLDRVYQDTLGLSNARLSVVAGFDSGRSVISYMGHSGPTRWTFDPLLDINQVLGTSTQPGRPNLQPSANQPIVLQYACWTTYFVSASQNSMAQALLLTPGRGASAIVGATVLLDQRSHQRMADALAGRLQVGARIGDIVQAAKLELAGDLLDPAGPEIMLGQVLLGDPAQRVR